MFIVLVWRPEACEDRSQFQGDVSPVLPFDGIEILGVVEDEDGVNALIDRAQKNMEPVPGTWKFHYEELPIPQLFPGGVKVGK
jgi:hypothetical protein